MRRVTITFLFTGLFVLGASTYPIWKSRLKRRDIERKVAHLPAAERKALSDFFYQLVILESAGGYTLFGDKPLSVANCFYGTDVMPNISHLHECKQMEMGLDIWKKYSCLFPSTRFSIVYSSWRDRVHAFYIVNRSRCLEVIDQNKDLFRDFGSLKGEKQIYAQLLKNLRENAFSAIELGVLFGFGRSNALAFERVGVLQRAFSVSPRLPERDLRGLKAVSARDIAFGSRFINQKKIAVKSLPTPSKGYNSIGEEYAALRGAGIESLGFRTHWGVSAVDMPRFMAAGPEQKPGSETDLLLKSYAKTRVRLAQLAKSKDFLVDCLMEWSE